MKSRIAFFSFVLLFVLMTSLFMPGIALADDGIPPTAEPVSSEDLDQTIDLPAEPQLPEASTDEVEPAAEQDAGLIAPAETETVADVVETLGEVDAVLADEDGDPISFATQEAAEVLG